MKYRKSPGFPRQFHPPPRFQKEKDFYPYGVYLSVFNSIVQFQFFYSRDLMVIHLVNAVLVHEITANLRLILEQLLTISNLPQQKLINHVSINRNPIVKCHSIKHNLLWHSIVYFRTIQNVFNVYNIFLDYNLFQYIIFPYLNHLLNMAMCIDDEKVHWHRLVVDLRCQINSNHVDSNRDLKTRNSIK